ncbi:nuclease-related domain-containing DEAD/DEAH box helicase [Erwinia sp. Leaf53]|uniref:nuclease-related domain-containing DEAD/DEAH box helicase n=1 Tax=Erwinia sp. Leaf53 TaxID=1736225 RepID=UPI0006FB960C|nr:NERD domain-containing protein [Erwinia sp. Leaf53]KQN54354.1 hypothetical protein ASF13_13065 [Erwinia sp. Leaf53]
MAIFHPDFANIARLTVAPTEGEYALLRLLADKLDNRFEVFFNAWLDGDRPDIIVLRQGYGALIFEVKDWNLLHYRITPENHWIVNGPRGEAKIRSPHQQVFRYKSNLFDLHLPILGLKEALNRAFYRLIDTAVYFHPAGNTPPAALYDSALAEIKRRRDENNQQFRQRAIEHAVYERTANGLKLREIKLVRDRSISVTPENLAKKIAQLQQSRPDPLFTDDIYHEFKRRLAPPESVLNQGIAVKFDKKQLRLTLSETGLSKIKGIAGSGKTTMLAQRAVHAFARHQSAVLILTFNLTLKPFIHDKVSALRGTLSWDCFEISNYHQFFNAALNELNISVETFLQLKRDQGLNPRDALDALYKHAAFFADGETRRYHTILIDEIQDYEPEWVQIIRQHFLADDGEMVLYGDRSQNIYMRDDKKRELAITQGFGRWETLTRSYRSRLDTPLVHLFKRFQEAFLIGKYSDAEIFESEPLQSSMNFDLLEYHTRLTEENAEAMALGMQKLMREQHLHPNDVVIICSSIDLLSRLNSAIAADEKTMVMFETEQEIEALKKLYPAEASFREARDKLRRRKKNFFMQNSGLVKLSTPHSYKGMECKTAFVVLTKDDDAELVYTAITRAKSNLIVFGHPEGRYHAFFEQTLTP